MSAIKSKLSFYTRYDRLGASSRIRFLQFIPKLEKLFAIKCNFLLPNEYIRNLYAKQPQNKVMILTQYLKRFLQMLFDRSNYIIIEKELFPYAPYWVEKLCLGNKKYIIDIDDAVFLNYEQSRNKHIRKFLGNKFNQLFANSSAVLAGSPYLVEKARQAAASKVIYYPTVIELDKYNPSQLAHVRTNANEFIIGWIGSNSTVKYLQVVHEALSILSNKFSDQCKLKLYIIGAQLDWRIPGVQVKLIPWSEASEVTEIYKIDVGIMPLEDTQWERGKCAYKLIQYMACSKPVIASKVGANNYVVQPGNNGFLCDGVAEWVAAFSELIEQPEMQIKLGHNGRLRVEREFTVDANLQLMHQLLMIEQL